MLTQIMYAKRDYYTNCVDRNRNNTKQMWKHINQLVNKNSRSTNISVLQIDEQVITENETIADLFNEYFTDIGPNLSNQITETNTDFKRYMKFKTQHTFNFENININEVLNALEKLKTSKSTGHDNIPAKQYSNTEPKEPSCSIEKIIPQAKSENSITFSQSLKGFRVGHLNIASLVKHVDELKIYL